MSYPIPKTTLETSLEVKKSAFHACAGFAPDRASAMAILDECKARYPDARHHCWAYLLGDPKMATSAAMSDDGEPSGTAGKPILNVLQHRGVGDVMVVVSRYFGGVKLGAGGLVRAYSSATQKTMENLPIIKQLDLHSCAIECGFQHEQYLRLWLAQHQGQVQQCDYHNVVLMQVSLPKNKLEELDAVLASLREAKRLHRK